MDNVTGVSADYAFAVIPVVSAFLHCRWDVPEPSVTWERLMQNKNKELDRLNGVYMKLLDNAGVEYIEGRGTVVDAHTVEVNGKQYTVCAALHSQLVC